MSTYYVSATAIGSNNGTSLANAWTAFSGINRAALNPGDIIQVYSGLYNEAIGITKGGSSGNLIYYVGNPINGQKPILRGITGNKVNYVGIIGLQFTQNSGNAGGSVFGYTPIYLTNVTGWLIQDNYFYQTYGGAFGGAIEGHYGTWNSYCTIRGNTFNSIGMFSGWTGGGEIVIFYGNNNLFEYNTFWTGLDRLYINSSQSITRNNLDLGTNELLFPQSSPYPYHIDDVQGGATYTQNGPFTSAQSYIEKNLWFGNAGVNGHNVIMRDALSSGLAYGIVVRQNISIAAGSAFCAAWQGILNSRVYNNTVSYSLVANTGIYNSTMQCIAPQSTGIIYINNTAYFTNTSGNVIDNENITNEFMDYNHTFGGGGSYPSGAHNLTGNPLFANPISGLGNYSLLSNSPLTGAAVYQTTASGAGIRSNLINVFDATYFTDGFGIAEGDYIQIGSNGLVRVKSVNYTLNQIKLAQTISWNNGDSIYLKGTADIGAIPYYTRGFFLTGYLTNVANNFYEVGVSDTNLVRYVLFYENGVPISQVFTYPYTYISSGGNVTANAYSFYASLTPVVQCLSPTISTAIYQPTLYSQHNSILSRRN